MAICANASAQGLTDRSNLPHVEDVGLNPHTSCAHPDGREEKSLTPLFTSEEERSTTGIIPFMN